MYLKNIFFLKFLFLGVLFFLCLFFFLNINILKKHKEFEIIFLDVGQGNSTLIKYKKINFLIDAGNKIYARKNLYNNLSFFETNLDFIFATHYDYDHIGNFLNYLKKYKISYFFRNGKNNKTLIFSTLSEITKKEKIKNLDLIADNILKIDNNFYIKILFPDKEIDKKKLQANNSSLILQIFYKNKKFLITGDASKKIEKWLVKKYGKKLKSDILVAGHHGSKTSSSKKFLKMVKPKLVIFSVGKNNSYHHPHKQILNLLKKLNIKFLRTDKNGNIKYFLENKKWKLELEKK